jgi:hypothetical protein
MFSGTQKQDDRGPLSIQSALLKTVITILGQICIVLVQEVRVRQKPLGRFIFLFFDFKLYTEQQTICNATLQRAYL